MSYISLDENSFNDDWLLDTEEIELASRKYKLNKLVFAVMLKIFQHEIRFPTNNDIIPSSLISELAKQISVNAYQALDVFDWESRSIERFRNEIRAYLGYRKPTIDDGEKLIAWLIKDVLPEGINAKKCRYRVYDYFKSYKIELLKPIRLDRQIQSAYQQFEAQLFFDICSHLNDKTKASLDALVDNQDDIQNKHQIRLKDLKKDPSGFGLKSVEKETAKLNCLRGLALPKIFLVNVSRKILEKYYLRVMGEPPSDIVAHDDISRYAMLSIFSYVAGQQITDNLNEMLIQRIHQVESASEMHINKKVIKRMVKVEGKFDILQALAESAAFSPKGIIEDVIYPKVDQETLERLALELKFKGKWYDHQVKVKMRSLYSHCHRKIIFMIINKLNFQTRNPVFKPILESIELLLENTNNECYFATINQPQVEPLISSRWLPFVCEKHTDNQSGKLITKINRYYYELAILERFRELLRCKNIWVDDAYRYRDPEKDLPQDWEANRKHYYKMLNLPLTANDYIREMQDAMHKHLNMLDEDLPSNTKVKILDKQGGWIKVTPTGAQEEPKNIHLLHRAIQERWSTINLLDILKEVDLRIFFTSEFQTTATRQILDIERLRKRLLLCIHALGTNTGLKRIAMGNDDTNYSDLRYVKRRYIARTHVRNAIVKVINKLLDERDPMIWSSATTGCACDSTQVKAWDQNLMAGWHPRYRSQGVMIYWHVDKHATCIYSQLKTCTSSEVGSMIEGVLRHSTKMDMKETYVDTHGQSTVGFGFSGLLKFDLLPRLKRIHKQKLYYPFSGDRKKYPNLDLILEKPIKWNLIREQYDEMIKNAVALKIGTAETDVILKRFSKDNFNHPTYLAICELGKVIKTIFLCRYLSDEKLRVEINEALNVVERVNGFMAFIFYGRLGEISTNKKADQELAILCLHLLQVCMVYINTLMIQEILSNPVWDNRLNTEDRRALTPLIHAHINPYGLFPLDMKERINIGHGSGSSAESDVKEAVDLDTVLDFLAGEPA